MKKIGGWARIGIVISLLWSLAVFGFAAREYFKLSKERNQYLALPAPPKGFVMEPKSQALLFEWQPVDLLATDSSVYIRDFQLQVSRLLMLWLFPIIALWLLPFVVVFTFKWVKAGFSKID